MTYLSDVFEAPRLRDQMTQYDKVLKNLAKQKSYNEESCKQDMKYHRRRCKRRNSLNVKYMYTHVYLRRTII